MNDHHHYEYADTHHSHSDYASDGHDHYDYADRHHRHHDDESMARGLREDLGHAEQRIADLERSLGEVNGKVADNLVSLNEIFAELAAKVATDPAFLDMAVGVLRDHTWKLGYEFQGNRAPPNWHEDEG